MSDTTSPPWKEQSVKWLARFKERLKESVDRPSLRRRMLLATARPPQNEAEWLALREQMLALIRELESSAPEADCNPRRAAEDRATADAIEWFEKNFPQAPNERPAPKQAKADSTPLGLRVRPPQPWPEASQELICWLKAAKLPPGPIELTAWRTITDPAKWQTAAMRSLARGPAYPSARCVLRDVEALWNYLSARQAV